jgi:hypothetical protein
MPDGVSAARSAGALVSPEDNGRNSIHRNFVQRCLKDLGYDVIGWK